MPTFSCVKYRGAKPGESPRGYRCHRIAGSICARADPDCKIVLMLTLGVLAKLVQKWVLMPKAAGKNDVRWLLQMSAVACVFLTLSFQAENLT